MERWLLSVGKMPPKKQIMNSFVIVQVVALGGTIAESAAAWMILMETAKLTAPILIIWYAWKSKQKA